MSAQNPSAGLDALLAEREWVRRLARALAGDPHAADDLEQDAWTRLLAQPPHTPGALRGWLRRVMRRRLAELHRGRTRRARREQAAARPEAVATTAEIVARAEAHRAVVDAVLALPEPLRTTVVLRFFEGLDTAAIAARAGVPADTVRARLRRALVVLRERLAPRDDVAAAWAPLLAADSAAHAPGASASARASARHPAPRGAHHPGGPTVSTSSALPKIGALAAGVLLAAGLAAWWVLRSAPADDVAAARPDAAGATAEDPADAAAERAARRAAAGPGTADTDAPLAGGVAGTALVGDVRRVVGDVPAEGVEVTLAAPGGTLRATTDALGGYRFDGLPPEGVLAVAARAPGCGTARAAGLRLAPGEVRRLPTLWLDAPVAVHVLVEGPRGEPVTGALVEAYRVRDAVAREDWEARAPAPDATATTTEDGRTAFDDLAVGTWLFRATHAQLASAGSERVPVLRGGVAVDVRLALAPGHELTGTLTAADGAPIADALVVAVPPVDSTVLMDPAPTDPRRTETRTDAAGRYRFDALATGEHALALVRPGALPARLGVVSIPSVRVFDARLDGGVLRGRVTEEGTGRPLAGAVVRAAVWRRHSPTFLAATTDADGRYVLDVPIGGIVHGPARGEGEARSQPVNFDVLLDGYAFAPELCANPWRTLWVLDGDVVDFDLVLRPAAVLAGTVRGPEGPVAGAQIVADVWNGLRGSVASTTTSDESGAYRFGGLPAGRARLVVTRSGYVQAASPGAGWRAEPAPEPGAVVEIPASGAVAHDIVLARGAALRGRVVDEAGAGVAAATVEAVSGALTLRAGTDADGRFELDGLRPGSAVALRAEATGCAAASVELGVGDGAEPLDVELRLRRLGSVRGRVTGPGGGVPDGAWVQVAPAEDALEGRYEIVSVWQRAARRPVAPDGRFEAAVDWWGGRAEGGVVVRAGAPGCAPVLSATLDVGADDVDAGTLELAAGLRLTGRVVAADGGGPVAGAEIEFQNGEFPAAFAQRRDWSSVGRDRMPFEFVARSGADGRFEVQDLPPWRYELRVSADGFGAAAPVVAVPQEGELTVELARLAPLAGHVRWDDGAPAAGLIVAAHPADGSAPVFGLAETHADGAFTFERLPAGRYVLEARRAWDRDDVLLFARTPEAVESGSDDVEIVVTRGGVTLAGVCVTRDGAAVPSAILHAKPAGGGPVVHAVSRPDGSFRVTALEGAGPFELTAEATRVVGGPEGFGRSYVAQLSGLAAGATGLRLEFAEAAPIAGRVACEDGSVPPGRLMVQAQRAPGGTWTHFAQVGDDGAFRIDSATLGTWTLVVVDMNSGVRLAASGGADVAGGREDVRLVVARAASLAGRVTDERGRGVVAARVRARGADGSVLPDVLTDAEGRFRWTAVPDGLFSVEATEPATGRAVATHVAPGDESIALVLRAESIVRGRLLGADGAPLRGATLVLAAEDGRDAARLRTDADGRFTTRSLPRGDYAVRLVERDGVALPAPLPVGTLSAGQPETVFRI